MSRTFHLDTNALIAACAIHAECKLLTADLDDFGPFAELGLEILR